MLTNILSFKQCHHQHALAFLASLSGSAELAQAAGGEWQIQFQSQVRRGQTVFYGVLPDGRVVSRCSKVILEGVVATIQAQSSLERIRGDIWLTATRDYGFAREDAALPEGLRDGPRWDLANKLVQEFATAEEFATRKVREANLEAHWDALSWRQSIYSANEYARKVRNEKRWGGVEVIKLSGGL
ncbi:hypothetical protein ACI77O_12605 [Pseudomonas tritici]|uniref:hypothetical protein n=1 Tax=Pseudomonas tritici TaxID=2745518 RepID=UPI00387B4D4B